MKQQVLKIRDGDRKGLGYLLDMVKRLPNELVIEKVKDFHDTLAVY